jgi:chemosensory pili system protein ChpA (sensor histidine kinase/response regulator)
VNDVATVQQSIISNLDTTDAALNAQGRIARSLQNQLQSIRTVAFNNLRERLYRVMRQTARELGKRANMEINGGDLTIDRSVLERLAPLIEHVLRNALAHGIELPTQRVAANKSETGEISVDLRQQGNLVEVSISDDGRGFDLNAIRKKAIALGMATEDEERTAQQWIDLIFVSGFTTSSEVTSVAGRGVGMDVVRTELGAFGGRVEARHEEGKGARFVLVVPLTLSVLNAVMVRVGKNRYGIPAAMVETVKAVKSADLMQARAIGSIQHGRETVPFVSIHHALAEEMLPRDEPVSQSLVVRAGSEAMAIDVDAVLGNQEVVLKRMGPQLSRAPGLLGVTLMGDGEIVLLYNPMTLHGATLAASAQAAAPTAQLAAADGLAVAPDVVVNEAPQSAVVVPIRPSVVVNRERPLVMVVDDSLTVRKITTRFLEREGFRAISAKDGMEALTLLSDNKPAVILLDIEMPRMDGFEFTRAAKGDAQLRSIPIIMITSRTAEKHRNHAMELGVNVYLGKPYQDEELLKHINTFVHA